MTSGDEQRPDQHAPRRALLAGIGAGTASLAGCGSIVNSAEPLGTSTETDHGAGDTVTDAPSKDAESDGGIPVVGLTNSPDTLNPLAGSHSLLTRMLYTNGTEFHPTTSDPIPWAYEDWTLDVENIGTSSPTLVGRLREDLTFSDETQITAEDAKFTIDYIRDQDVAGFYGASDFSNVEAVQVDDPKGLTVSYYFSAADAAWFSRVIGQILLPKHVWKDVSDYQRYSPATGSDGMVGSGAFEVDSVDFGNWFELDLRSHSDVWQTNASGTDWYHPEAPFVDAVRIQVFGSTESLQRSVRGGDIDAAFAPVSIDRAVQAQEIDSLDVKVSQTAGWHHHSYNTRRVPLDDRAFRQFLVKLVDKHWIVEDFDRGIGSVEGSYALPRFNPEWRPPEPTEQDSYHGIPTPSLNFPGQAGTFELSSAETDAIRSFLTDHSGAAHDYSWQDGQTNATASGESLHIDGVPFEEAHTDNDGHPNQGPLVVSFNPPEDDLDEARIAQQFVSILRGVGIPTEARVQSLGSQTTEVFGQEEFDVVALNWTNLPPDYTYFEQLFGHWGADLSGDVSTPLSNAMGYTGADDLIRKQRSMMNVEQRKEIVKELAARIWNDAPTNIVKHDTRLQPVNRAWEGWIETTSLGVLNLHTFLNLRRSSGTD